MMTSLWGVICSRISFASIRSRERNISLPSHLFFSFSFNSFVLYLLVYQISRISVLGHTTLIAPNDCYKLATPSPAPYQNVQPHSTYRGQTCSVGRCSSYH